MAYKRSPLVCVNVLLFRLYVLLQKHKVGKMQLVLQKIVVAILLFSVVESPLGVQAQPPRECDFKVDDVSCSRTRVHDHFLIAFLPVNKSLQSMCRWVTSY